MSATYESDMKYCEEAIRHGSLSFHAASLLLPRLCVIRVWRFMHFAAWQMMKLI